MEKKPESLCLSGKANSWIIILRNSQEQAVALFAEMRAWQFYKQILMLLPRGDCVPFHTELYNYNLKWLVHIQFRSEHITQHQWQGALQLTQHGALWLHSFFFLLDTDRRSIIVLLVPVKALLDITEWAVPQIMQQLHILHFMFWPILQATVFDCDSTVQRAARNKSLTSLNIREKPV